MAPTRGPDWKRLGRYVKARREQLDMLQEEFSVRSGVSRSTLQYIEGAAQTAYRRDTFRDLEAGLRWAPGSAKAILDGGEPTELADEPEDDFEARVDRLLDGLEKVSGTVGLLAERTGDLEGRVRELEDRVGQLEPPARPRRR